MGAGGFGAFELVLDRTDSLWLQNLRDENSTGNVYYLYPIHASRSFLFTPTLSSALYLLLLRLISGQYDLAFRLIDFCVTDTKMTPEEEQIVRQLVTVEMHDTQINAVACRLKFILVTAGTPMSDLVPWDSSSELVRYLRSLTHVSGACRLTRAEELLLLELQATGDEGVSAWTASPLLINRINFLHKLDAAPLDVPFQVQVLPPLNDPSPYNFDSVVDKSCMAVDDTFLKKMSTISYSKPKDEHLSGVQGALLMRKWTSKAGRMRLRGGKDELGFLFLYELMTEQISLRMLPGDSSFNWGALLLRFLPKEDTGKADVLSSILRAMAYNRNLASAVPKFEDARKFKISTIFRGQNVLQRLLMQFKEYSQKYAESIRFPPYYELFEHPPAVMVPCPNTLLGHEIGSDRTLLAPRVANHSRESAILKVVDHPGGVKVTLEELDAFSSVPLSSLCLDDFVVSSSKKSQGGQAFHDQLPFDVDHHPASKSHVARDILKRLKKDIKFYADSDYEKVTPTLLGFSSSDSPEEGIRKLETLISKLGVLKAKDDKFITAGTEEAIKLANKIDVRPPGRGESQSAQDAFRERLAVVFSRDHGQEPTVWLALLVGTSLSSNGFDDLKKLNPFLSEKEVENVEGLVVSLMLTINRAGLLARCTLAARDLLDLMQGQKLETSHDDVVLQSAQLAQLLTTRRYFIDMDTREYDPRFLVFEFMQDIVLRGPQVDLINQFKESIKNGDSRCHQMLMGGGKTTVVAPMLALLLGSVDSLVVQVVPRALFEFSISVMRACFSAVLQKQVYTFVYDRFTPPTNSLLQKLLKAKAARGIVVATPTALKSFTLKFVETCNAIVELKASIETGKETADLSYLTLLGRRIGDRLKLKEQGDQDRAALDALTHQAELCVRILALFHSGTLLLDEVDLILHPLKSELNWPMGSKAALDFTQIVGASKKAGLRWSVPFYLLDAIFFASNTDARMSVDYEQSREALVLLQQLREVIDEGYKRMWLQKSPHLVVTHKPYYHTHFKPILAKWMVVYLASFGITDVSNEDLLVYITSKQSDNEVKSKAFNHKLNDEQMKVTNLTRDWLCSFLPHVLTKINRVHYGLLTPDDLQRALKLDPNMPEARKLLAVPFVGKDVPSRASEFAHPDVVIGLSSLAFRYEGLRLTDFVQVMKELRARMGSETGPYKKRSACRLFARWVGLAGGRVRGFAKPKADIDYLEHEKENLREFIRRAAYLGGRRSDEEMFQDIWPLQLIDLQDEEQVHVLFRLLQNLPHIVEYYLNEFVFPVTTRHQGLKLTSCGQALGGNLLFKQRLGFSGTPSDMLPVELGKCHYEPGSDGKMIHLLDSPEVVTYEVLESKWGPEGILDHIIASKLQSSGMYHALLDTGALITGMNNLQVASYLLNHGLETCFDGVVFLDENDKTMILLRHGLRVVDLSQCGVPKERRFTFYDQVHKVNILILTTQVHTTGIDIKHMLSATALLTLGKDMTFRDYAQGAFRMRGIGNGQTIHVLVIPEVMELMQAEAKFDKVHVPAPLVVDANPVVLQAISTWLVVNSMRAEKLQFNLLCEQSARNVWRKRAYGTLMR